MLIAWVLVVMVGTTVQVLQSVGWMPVTPIAACACRTGRALVRHLPDLGGRSCSRSAAFLFVIGSYLAAEAVRKRRRNRMFVRSPARTPERVREPFPDSLREPVE